ncbi:MAG: DegT/DnrJ/EryC1/StrS family aminotransferase [Thaumarchaeota archaeon]|nr:DegT/DnrJ/EryC1/StrS family aminotransferase [Nitrososphaerota archaeon]
MRIRINEPFFGDEEANNVIKVLRSLKLTSSSYEGGEMVREFEGKLRDYLGVKDVVAVNSGTSALLASMMAIGLKPGDEVLVPSLTFGATANVVLALGGRPVFVDIDLDNYTMSPEDARRKVTERTKALIPVHLFGHLAKMDELLELAEEKGLYVIEDACQAIGSVYKGRKAGSIGELGCFSFYASKPITSGEGGAVATNDEALADRLRLIRNQGMRKGYDYETLGLNLRMPEIEASILSVQMDRLEGFIEARRRNARLLSEGLDGLGIELPKELEGMRYNWYLYTIATEDRDGLLNHLNEKGVEARVYYDPPVHLSGLYSKRDIRLPKTEYASKRILSLPVHQKLDREAMSKIVELIKIFIRKGK